MRRHKITILSLSVFLFLLLQLVSITGLFTEDFYAKETSNWQVQSVGQDWVDLFIISPLLLISSFLMYKGKSYAKTVWAGIIFYLTYTFTIYCFDVQFNQLFLVYCVILGLSFYLSVYFILDGIKEQKKVLASVKIRRVIAGYFISIALIFYLLWLYDIIPAVTSGTVPISIIEAGLPTNAVHVIDLAIFLPAVFICGIALLKKHWLGNLLAPPLLLFFVLMNVTISVLNFFLYHKGLAQSQVVGFVMIFLAVMSTILLVVYQHSMLMRSPYEKVSENIHAVPATV